MGNNKSEASRYASNHKPPFSRVCLFKAFIAGAEYSDLQQSEKDKRIADLEKEFDAFRQTISELKDQIHRNNDEWAKSEKQFRDRISELEAYINELRKEREWIPVSKRLPDLSDFYITTQDLEDGEPPLTWPFYFSSKTKKWFRDMDEKDEEFNILGWQIKPKPMLTNWKPEPLNIPPISMDEYEMTVYGQCVHGENMANCDICNPT